MVDPKQRLPLERWLEHPWLSGEAPPAPAPAPAALVLAERKPPPLDLQKLLKLQLSLGRSLQIALLACRQSHPQLAARIRQAILQAYMLWQHALKVVGQYAQAGSKADREFLKEKTRQAIAGGAFHGATGDFHARSGDAHPETCREVAQKVIERVLPDLDLAVQEAQPDLGVELLSMVEGWVGQMTADGETTTKLCEEMVRTMGELITQAAWRFQAKAWL